MEAEWMAEKESIERVRGLKEEIEIDPRRGRAGPARRRLPACRRAHLRRLPELERDLEAAAARLDEQQAGSGMLKEEVVGRERRRGGGELDRHPRPQPARGRDGEARAHGGPPAPAGRRPGRGGDGGRERDPALARRPGRPRPADRLVHLPRPHRGGEDRARQGARRVPVRLRAGDDPHRHVRVHGEALGLAAGRRAAGLRRLRRGRPADRGRAPAAVLGRAARRDREGPPGRVQHPAAAARRRPPHRRPGTHGRLSQYDRHHDLERRLRVHLPRRRRGARARARRRGAAGDVPARVPQPRRRGRHLPAPVPGAADRHRRAAGRRAAAAAAAAAGSSSS